MFYILGIFFFEERVMGPNQFLLEKEYSGGCSIWIPIIKDNRYIMFNTIHEPKVIPLTKRRIHHQEIYYIHNNLEL